VDAKPRSEEAEPTYWRSETEASLARGRLEDSRTRSMLVEPAPLLSGNGPSVPAFGGYLCVRMWLRSRGSARTASRKTAKVNYRGADLKKSGLQPGRSGVQGAAPAIPLEAPNSAPVLVSGQFRGGGWADLTQALATSNGQDQPSDDVGASGGFSWAAQAASTKCG